MIAVIHQVRSLAPGIPIIARARYHRYAAEIVDERATGPWFAEMQRLNQPVAPPVTEFKRPNAGGMIMVINAQDLEKRWDKIKTTPNIKVDTEPYRIEYPGPNNSKIPVLFSSVFDNDGNFIEINKLLGTVAGTEAAKK